MNASFYEMLSEEHVNKLISVMNLIEGQFDRKENEI